MEVDFSLLDGAPISHDRIGLFNSGLVTASTYGRDVSLFARTRPEHLRIDLGWGAEWMPWTRELVTIDERGTSYDFRETDEIAAFLTSVGVRPYWSYCYVPCAVRVPGSDWRTIAGDDAGWVAMVTEYVRGAKERGVQMGYHEIYNEPDLRDERTAEPVFFAGDLDDYLQLYRVTAPAIRKADPRAKVGGPALGSVAANAHWLRAFLDMIAAENLPLDFLSFHHYGSFGLAQSLETVVKILDEYEQFHEVELHLNEYNSFTIDYPQGGLQDSYLLAGAFAEDVEQILNTRRLTRISWAQFLDSGNGNFSGMVDIDGQAKPLFYAYEFLQKMPLDRRETAVSGARGVGALASADAERAAVLLWNRSSTDQLISVNTVNSPSADATIRLIDADHRGDTTQVFDGAAFRLQRGAVACIEYGEPAVTAMAERWVRARFHYGANSPEAWTDVDEMTGIVRFGTGPAGVQLRAGYDFAGDTVPLFETSITYADGSPAPGVIDVTSQPDTTGGFTVWFTLRDVPANVFARIQPILHPGAI